MPARYASISTRENISKVVGEMEECQKNPMAYAKIQDKAAFTKRLDTSRQQLETITPPDTTGAEKDKIVKRLGLLKDAFVKGNGTAPRALSVAELWKCPAGAPGSAIQHEQYWKTHNLDPNGDPVRVDPRKGQLNGIGEMKDLCRMLGKDAERDDPDVANLDVFRPSDSNIPLMDHRLPRSYGLSSQAKERFDETFPDREMTAVEKKIAAAAEKYPQESAPAFGRADLEMDEMSKYRSESIDEKIAKNERELQGLRAKQKRRDAVPVDLRCTHTKASGAPCKARKMKDSELCVFHAKKNVPKEV